MISIETSPLKKLKSSMDPVALFSFEDGLAGTSWLKPAVRKTLFARAQKSPVVIVPLGQHETLCGLLVQRELMGCRTVGMTMNQARDSGFAHKLFHCLLVHVHDVRRL